MLVAEVVTGLLLWCFYLGVAVACFIFGLDVNVLSNLDFWGFSHLPLC